MCEKQELYDILLFWKKLFTFNFIGHILYLPLKNKWCIFPSLFFIYIDSYFHPIYVKFLDSLTDESSTADISTEWQFKGGFAPNNK